MFRSLALVPVLSITAAVNGATIYVSATNCPGPGDIDGGGIGITDFLALLANWGPCS